MFFDTFERVKNIQQIFGSLHQIGRLYESSFLIPYEQNST
jgi:hypothetical protein